MCLRNHNIPAEFFSFDKDAPFENCIVCNRSLLIGNVPYVIEKAYKSYQNFTAKDIIYEYAMCQHCIMELSDEVSVSSKSAVQNYVQSNSSFIHASMLGSGDINVKSLLSNCVIKGKSIEESSEFTIYGMFRGGKLAGDIMPYMICDDALNEISDCLSLETKEELEFFFDEFFAGPPEFAEILKTKPLIF